MLTNLMILFLALNAVIAIYKWGSVDKSFKPFFVYLFASAFIEIHAFIFNNYFSASMVAESYNIYVLLEALIWLWLFERWGLLEQSKVLAFVLYGSMPAVWVADLMYMGSLNELLTFFRIYYSFVLVLLAINSLNLQIVNTKKNLLTDSKFLIGSAVVIMYTNKILLEAFYLIFTKSSFLVLVTVTIICKIILFLALLWTPKKPKGIRMY